MKRSFILLSLLALISCSNEQEVVKKEVAKPVKMLTLGEQTSSSLEKFPGKVLAGKEADITFKVSGKLNNLPVKEGQRVKKGDIIAELDKKDYKYTYEKSLANFNEQESSFNRAKELIKNKYISQADFDKKKKAFEVAKADLNIARTNLEYTTLEAPFDGIISNIYVDNYQNVQVKEKIVTLQNLDFLEVKFFIPEKLAIAKVNPKNINISVRLDVNKDVTYPAKISEISTQADEKTQTYEVTVRFKRPEDVNVFPGMTATVEGSINLETKTSCNCYDIPSDALFTDSSQESFVWLINKENRIEKHKVKTRNLKGDKVTIENGLTPGAKIVSAGVNFLHEGQLVTEYNKQ